MELRRGAHRRRNRGPPIPLLSTTEKANRIVQTFSIVGSANGDKAGRWQREPSGSSELRGLPDRRFNPVRAPACEPFLARPLPSV